MDTGISGNAQKSVFRKRSRSVLSLRTVRNTFEYLTTLTSIFPLSVLTKL